MEQGQSKSSWSRLIGNPLQKDGLPMPNYYAAWWKSGQEATKSPGGAERKDLQSSRDDT